MHHLDCIRGHSTTTWTEFCHFLTPASLCGQFLYHVRGQKQTFFDSLPLILSTYIVIEWSLTKNYWTFTVKIKIHCSLKIDYNHFKPFRQFRQNCCCFLNVVSWIVVYQQLWVFKTKQVGSLKKQLGLPIRPEHVVNER